MTSSSSSTLPPNQSQQFSTYLLRFSIAFFAVVLVWKATSMTSANNASSAFTMPATFSNSQQQQQQQQNENTNVQRPPQIERPLFKISSSEENTNKQQTEETYYEFVSSLLNDNLGPFSSIFDVDLVVTVAKLQNEKFTSTSSSTKPDSTILPCKGEANMNWIIQYRTQLPGGPPSCLSTWKEGVSTIKFYIGLALSKIAHDKELDKMYNALRSAVDQAQQQKGEAEIERATQNALHEFKFATAKMISAHIHHLISAIQTLYDGFHPASITSIVDEIVNAPVLHASSTTTKNQQREKGSSSSSSLGQWLNDRIQTTVASTLLHQTNLDYHRQPPLEGKFWNILRTEIGCASLERSCENPEGCRYICNREYLLRGGSTVRKSSSSSSSGHQKINNFCSRGKAKERNNLQPKNDDTIAVLNAIVGRHGIPDESIFNNNNNNFASHYDAACIQLVSFGSNNEFDWEDSMTEVIRATNSPFSGIATFDCTLHNGVNPSPIMKKLMEEDKNLFQFYPYCIGVADERMDSLSSSAATTNAGGEGGGKSISLAELDGLLKKIGGGTSSTTSSNRVSILKMDIESFEFVAAPRWLQVEMAKSGKQLSEAETDTTNSRERKNNQNNNNYLIDFTTLENLVSVEQLQTEIHRRGHKNKRAAGFAGAMWLQWLLLNYHALGFVTVATEKNHVDNCCFEAVFVNYRYYIASQSWYAATTTAN